MAAPDAAEHGYRDQMADDDRGRGDGARPAGRRRDRHGRGPRGPLLPVALPASRTRSQRFDGHVLDAVSRLESRWADPLSDVDVAVEVVPPSDPRPWEEQVAPLGRVFPAAPGQRARLVVYRRPIEGRTDDDLARLVHEVVVEQVASLLGRSPEDIDPGVVDD